MTDFTRWLYANYIWPHLKAQDPTGYETPLSLMDNCLDDDLKKDYCRTMEFYAGHAFLLGLRTGAELEKALSVPETSSQLKAANAITSTPGAPVA